MTSSESHADRSLAAALQVMYGPGGLGESPIFAGDLINFGYWRQIPTGNPTLEDRRQASLAFYDVLLDKLGPMASGRVLDIGCGRGAGCRRILEHSPSVCVTGLDLTFAQLRIAQKPPENSCLRMQGLNFIQGDASALPFGAGTFTAILSVEAVQHLPSVEDFASEVWRVLNDDGQIAVTTFFARGEKSLEPLRGLLPTVASKLDRIISIERVLRALAGAGFQVRRCDRVGEHVFPGFDRWIQGKVGPDIWSRRWLQAFDEGLLDYYVIVAAKRDSEGQVPACYAETSPHGSGFSLTGAHPTRTSDAG